MNRYSPKELEPKWQQIWEDTKLYQTSDDDPRPKWYQLEFFPYPSGVTMHVGHVRNYVISDAFARYKRMTGHNVLHPMGWDAFGLPAENQAIKTGLPARQSTEQNIAVFKRQLRQVGLSYDWSREINSSEPDYYRWTQWLFLLFHERKLAYKAESAVNWCPHDKTVLANEQVIKKDGLNVCERCGHRVEKRNLSQWFFKITDYADRLLEDLEAIDWAENVKAMQRNWIGRSVGAEIKFKLKGAPQDEVTVFTTRADTLAGVTFLVISPELAQQWIEAGWRVNDKVAEYVQASVTKSEIERQETDRKKTGVNTEITAINPLTKEDIPVWVADYVLGGYGTGAIMAVPAHDQRDYEFAQSFNLPVKQVIQPIVIDTVNPPKEGAKNTTRNVAQCLIYNPETDRYLTLKWRKFPWHTLVTGGIEAGEDEIEGAKREITEETGYANLKFTGRLPFSINSHFYAAHKEVNRDITMNVLAFELENDQTTDLKRDAHEDFEVVWVTRRELELLEPVSELPYILRWLKDGDYIYSGEGKIINSDAYDGLNSSEAREKITAELGTEQVNYKMRDWLISRQRYWGAPIPIVYCKECGIVPVPKEQLPVELPELESYHPSDDGRSPLARVEEWLNTSCPQCGGPAERETDTMDTFVDSSWYFLRFTDPRNDKAPFDSDKANHWHPVDTYVGGVEHAVAHLLFARFWTKVLQDAGLVNFGEPFKQLRNQGMIGGSDGRKMGKRYGNAVTPDELIDQGYGADALRLYELFIGPYDQGVDWNPTGIDGTKRFLNRVWALVQEHLEARKTGQSGDSKLETALAVTTHRAIKKVTFDIEQFGFNTAIAAMMEAVNELYKFKTELKLGSDAWHQNLKLLIQILAPFAPHMTEELWQQLGGETSVHVAAWPTFDESLVKEEFVVIAVQVNGKVRGKIEVSADASEDEAVQQAQGIDSVKAQIEGKSIVKTIYVPGKILNLVVG